MRFLRDEYEMQQLPDSPADELRAARMVIMEEELEAERRRSGSLPQRMNQLEADRKAGRVPEKRVPDEFDKSPLGQLLGG